MKKREEDKRIGVLFLGQVPPPVHGQAKMIEVLVKNPADDLRIHHVPLRFSTRVSDIGRFRFGKLVELCRVLVHGAYVALRWRPTVLYYPPSAGGWGLSMRDALICGMLRPLVGRMVLHCHGLGFENAYRRLDPFSRSFWSWALGSADVCIGPTQAVAQEAASLRAQKYVAVPYGVEDPALRGTVKQGPREDEETRILYVGNLIPSKGIRELMEAVGILRGQGHAVRLDVVGAFVSDGLEQELPDCDLVREGIVRLHGLLDGNEKWERYAAADLFCFPSYYESEFFPVVILEAMSFGLPVVSTTWRGIPSMVTDGTTGILVPHRDVRKLATALGDLVVNPNRRAAMGLAARKRFETEFTDEKYVEGVWAVVRRAAAGAA